MTFSAFAEQLSLYFRLTGAYVRSEMQYRVSFVLQLVGSGVVTAVDFGAIAVILSRVPLLAGWSLPEVALLYGMSSVSFSLAEMLAGSLDFFDEMIRQGTFDRLLIRPLGTLFQAMTEGFSLRRLGRVSQGAVVLVYAQRLLPVEWTAPKLALLFVAMASGVAIFFSIFVLGAVYCFWTVQGREATNVFTYGGDYMTNFPMDVYQRWFRRFITFVMPLAFVNYYPALYLLGKPDPLGLPTWVRLISPVAGALLGLVAWQAWVVGVRHYQSTGS